VADVLRAFDPVADPSGVGKDVVRAGATGGDELVANAAREGEVGQAVAVQVTELSTAEQELDTSEAMGPCRDARPGQHLPTDLRQSPTGAARSGVTRREPSWADESVDPASGEPA
jgi:hypothetical protein